MEFATWLRNWLTRHPLKAPAGLSRYTEEVMAKVRALQPRIAPVRSSWRWTLVPRLSLGLATVAAGLLFLMMRLTPGSAPELAVARDTSRLIRVAETSPSVEDESWLDETLQLFQKLDEELPSDVTENGDLSEEEWLDELDTLDQEDTLAASS